MNESDYRRIASRGIAAGTLEVLFQTLDVFRANAEAAGIRVNEDVILIRQALLRFSDNISADSWQDRNELIARNE